MTSALLHRKRMSDVQIKPTSGCFQQEESLEFDIRSFNRLRYLDLTSALFSLAKQRAGNTTLARTPLPLSRVCYQTTKPNRAYFYIHDRTRLRGSEYLVWLVITQWIGSPSVDKSAKVVWFFDHIFSKIFGEKC